MQTTLRTGLIYEIILSFRLGSIQLNMILVEKNGYLDPPQVKNFKVDTA